MYSPPFLSYKDDYISKHAEQLIKILKDQKIPLDKVIKVLKEQLATEAEERQKALEKEKGKEKAREKRQSTDLSKVFIPTCDLNDTRIDAINLRKVIVKNQISHSTPKTNIFNIVLCDISLDSSTHHWDQAKLDHMMGFMNPSCCGKSLLLYSFYLIFD